MLARVLRLAGSADKVDDGIGNYKSQVVPALKEQDGYSGARLLVNRGTGAAMSVTYWRDEEASRASFEAMASIRAETSTQFGSDQPVSKLYEAAVQQRPRPTEAGNWVRLTTLSGDATKVEDGIRNFESEVIPAMSQLQGFHGAVLLVDRTSGEAIAITIWDNERDLDASSSQAGPVRAAFSDAMGGNNPHVENYEVAFAELPAPVGT